MLINCLFVYLCQNLCVKEIKLIGLSFPTASFQERVWCLISSGSAVKPYMLFSSEERLTEFAQLRLACFVSFRGCSYPFWPKVLLLLKMNFMQCLLTVDFICENWGKCWLCCILLFCTSSLLCLSVEPWLALFAFQIVLNLFLLPFMLLANCDSSSSVAFLIISLCLCCLQAVWLLSPLFVLFSLDILTLKKLSAIVIVFPCVGIFFCKAASGWFMVPSSHVGCWNNVRSSPTSWQCSRWAVSENAIDLNTPSSKEGQIPWGASNKFQASLFTWNFILPGGFVFQSTDKLGLTTTTLTSPNCLLMAMACDSLLHTQSS